MVVFYPSNWMDGTGAKTKKYFACTHRPVSTFSLFRSITYHTALHFRDRKRTRGLFNLSVICERHAEPLRLTARLHVKFFEGWDTRRAVSASNSTPAVVAVAAPSTALAVCSSKPLATIPDEEEEYADSAPSETPRGNEKQRQQYQKQPQQQPTEFAVPRGRGRATSHGRDRAQGGFPVLRGRTRSHGRDRAHGGFPVLVNDSRSEHDFGPGSVLEVMFRI